jgi:hypothetical protein
MRRWLGALALAVALALVGSVALADLGATANTTGSWIPGLAIVGLFLAGVWFGRPRP